MQMSVKTVLKLHIGILPSLTCFTRTFVVCQHNDACMTHTKLHFLNFIYSMDTPIHPCKDTVYRATVADTKDI